MGHSRSSQRPPGGDGTLSMGNKDFSLKAGVIAIKPPSAVREMVEQPMRRGEAERARKGGWPRAFRRFPPQEIATGAARRVRGCCGDHRVSRLIRRAHAGKWHDAEAMPGPRRREQGMRRRMAIRRSQNSSAGRAARDSTARRRRRPDLIHDRKRRRRTTREHSRGQVR